MNKYEVVIRDKITENTWSLVFLADDFAHAEEQTNDTHAMDDYGEIIRITKDYDNE